MKRREHIILSLIFLVGISSVASCSRQSTSQNNEVSVINVTEHKSRYNKLDTLFISANREKILGNDQRAAELFLKCLRLDKKNSASMYELSRIYLKLGQSNDALYYAKNAASIDPDNKWYQELHARILRKKGKFEDAAKVYEILVEHHPKTRIYYFDWAFMLVNEKNWKEAIEVFDLFEQNNGIDKEVIFQKEQLYLKLDNFGAAVNEIEKLIKFMPKNASHINHLAQLYNSNGMYDKAFETYQKSLEVDPDNPNTHLAFANYYLRKGERDKYIEELHIAFGNPDLKIERKIEVLASDFNLFSPVIDSINEAYALCEVLISVHSSNARGYVVYGDFLKKGKRYEDALNQYKNAVKLDNSKMAYWDQVLFIEIDLEKYDSLVIHADQALEVFPTQLRIYYVKSSALLQLKNYEEVINAAEEGLEYYSDEIDLLSGMHANLGEAHYQLKNYPLSDTAYLKALEYDPNSTYVLNNYSYYLSLRNDKLDEASEMSKKANDIEPNNAAFQDTYGWILYMMSEFEEAKIWIEKSISNGGTNSGVIIEHYGDILYQLGDVEQAVINWKKARELGLDSDLIDKKISDMKLYE